MKIVSLQYIRGIAAVLVVYFHTSLQIEIATPGTSYLPLFGSVGVDVFFVLSGYVMWVSNPYTRRTSSLEFYRRRIQRVVPLYWLVTIAAALTAALIPQMARSVSITTQHLLASMLFVPWPNPAFPAGNPNAMTPIIVPGWTLNYEMFFYFLFGLVLPLKPVVRIGSLLACFIGFIVLDRLLDSAYPILAFYASSYLFEFLAGALIAVSVVAAPRIPLTLARLALVAGMASLLFFDVVGVTAPQALTRGLPAVLIVAGAVCFERRRAVPAHRLLELLGDASYSVYLVHGIALSLIRFAWIRAGLGFTASEQIAFAFVCIVGGIAAGVLTYRFVEQPLLRVGRRKGLIHVEPA